MINVVNDDCGHKPIRVKKNTEFFYKGNTENLLSKRFPMILPFNAALFYPVIFRETVF